ncbi:choice-of-anchor Q domain-containing protein [Marinifilum caeruleilacunae]|uniref:Right handed beta helix domain-containing protein n=1 Tax=Marinifilum caeruleilacunae TaxID=2499076 RepID=A0ABX1X1M1_9BACT|nr:choice-of-anchor Q domain-containing protein [Marinifilum caeruleilacunae]NOU62257.1 hypothetical protein [Marinifilum caeruleilacunae]
MIKFINSLEILILVILCYFCFNLCSACSEQNEEIVPINAVVYFIDSESGEDYNDGKSESSAWKSLKNIGDTKLNPGDEIRFKRGSNFSGVVTINDSGTYEQPIILSDYGNVDLHSPAFTNTIFNPENNQYGNCIRLKGSFVIVENLYCLHTVAELPENAGGFLTMWELGAIYIDKSAENCIVRNNEIYDCGVGIKSYGPYARIENNYIHDCNRVLKKWDWGPLAIWLGADNQEVCYNRIINYRVVNPSITWGPDSYGGGADGGAIEIDDARYPKSNISIHHNFSRDCQGFIEVTWTDVKQNPPYTDFEIHHNVSDDYQQFIALWVGANCKIENNTIIRRKKNVNDWGVINITQGNSNNYIRNNLIVVENDIVVYPEGGRDYVFPKSIISNNLYYALKGKLNMGLADPGANAIFVDPMLLDYIDGDSADDFKLTSASPAINAGLDLGYSKDFSDIDIPQNIRPDVGAFEFTQDSK